MSYDLYIIRAPRGAAPHEVAECALAMAEADLPTGEPSPEAEGGKRAMADALRAVNPMLAPFAFDYAEIARIEEIPEAEARRRYRHIELNGPEQGNGVQITLYDDWASVALPYWHRGAAAAAVWSEVWGYLGVFAQRGYVIYDPQLERPLDLGGDGPKVQRIYGDGVRATERAAAEIAAQSPTRRPPWWKVW